MVESRKGKRRAFPFVGVYDAKLIVGNVVSHGCLHRPFGGSIRARFSQFDGKRNGRGAGGNIDVSTFRIVLQQGTLVVKNRHRNAGSG